MEKKKIILNLDGIITAEDTLLLIADKFNVLNEIENLTREVLDNNIPFVEGLIRRVSIFKGLPVIQIAEFLENTRLHQYIVNFIQHHKKSCIIVTGGLLCWYEKLFQKIDCEHYCSEGIVENNQVAILSSILHKEKIVVKCQNEGFDVVYIGNENSDLEAMRIANISIAVGLIHPLSKSLVSATDYLIFNEKTLCRQLSQLL
jgi:HAD superfamily phosphoserine phosphatase-like hydrolase